MRVPTPIEEEYSWETEKAEPFEVTVSGFAQVKIERCRNEHLIAGSNSTEDDLS